MREIDVNKLSETMTVKTTPATVFESKDTNTSAISHPSHYNMGSIEVIDAIEEWGFGEGFSKGNAIKYIARAGRKNPDTEIEDLRKAITYLEFEIERLKKQNGKTI